ncbi:MAG: Co2+/Mg2+ efflux protein ApaG, partial [Candidatus Binatia bacterium]
KRIVGRKSRNYQERLCLRAANAVDGIAGDHYTSVSPFVISFVERLPVSTSEAVTQGIRVRVQAQYDPGRSRPHHNQWFFLYTVRIANESTGTVQLLSRHWIITDATGHVEEVQGPGVVGEQPVLAPGQYFDYTSGCPLTTPFGTMHGTYQMVTTQGERFDAQIAAFTLSEPHSVH